MWFLCSPWYVVCSVCFLNSEIVFVPALMTRVEFCGYSQRRRRIGPNFFTQCTMLQHIERAHCIKCASYMYHMPYITFKCASSAVRSVLATVNGTVNVQSMQAMLSPVRTEPSLISLKPGIHLPYCAPSWQN